MMRTKHALLLTALAASLCLSGCSGRILPEPEPTETTEAVTEPDKTLMEEITAVVTEEELYAFAYYPNLKRLDLTGSTCYEAINGFANAHPNIEIHYTVSFGGSDYDPTTTDLFLDTSQLDFDTLLENLQFLPKLRSLTLPKTNLSADELTALQLTYPEVAITYTVELLGQEYTPDTQALDLSQLTPSQVDAAITGITCLPNLETIELMPEEGASPLGKADVKRLVEAAPNAVIHYVFDLFGKTVSTTDETIRIQNVKITDAEEPELREALAILSGCDKLIFDGTTQDNDRMAAIRQDYTRTTLGWRVYFGKYTALTTDEVIRAVYNVFDDTCYNLRYVTGCKYMDLGHNDTLTDLSFVGYMTNIEILIVSGCAAQNLDGFENCKNLKFLEIANCYKLTDISALEGCESLTHLNMCYTKVSDITCLYSLPLECFICKQTRVPDDQKEYVKQLFPDAVLQFTGKQPYAGKGWRYIDNGYTYTEMYKKVREVFRLDGVPYSN